MIHDVTTPRLRLRSFQWDDLPAFTALHANPQTMVDYGRPDTAQQARSKLQRYLDCEKSHGISRLHVSDANGFIGYVGVFYHDTKDPLGPHAEIGWRLLPHTWGQGYASEAARAAFTHAFHVAKFTEILAYTAPDNLRSQAVMERLGLVRTPARDFSYVDPDVGPWSGLVWVANRTDWAEQDPA